MAITQKKLESSKDKDKNNSKLTINVCGCRGCAPVPIQTDLGISASKWGSSDVELAHLRYGWIKGGPVPLASARRDHCYSSLFVLTTGVHAVGS